MSTIWYFPVAHQLITSSLVEFIPFICILSMLQFCLVDVRLFIKVLPLKLAIFMTWTCWLNWKYCRSCTYSNSFNLTYDFIFKSQSLVNVVILENQQLK